MNATQTNIRQVVAEPAVSTTVPYQQQQQQQQLPNANKKKKMSHGNRKEQHRRRRIRRREQQQQMTDGIRPIHDDEDHRDLPDPQDEVSIVVIFH